MKLFTKDEVTKVDELMEEHWLEHLGAGHNTCLENCRRLALMISINVVIEDRIKTEG